MRGKQEAHAEIDSCRFFSFDKLPTHVRDHFIQRVGDFLAGDEGIVFRDQ
jgi:hypothetical protein